MSYPVEYHNAMQKRHRYRTYPPNRMWTGSAANQLMGTAELAAKGRIANRTEVVQNIVAEIESLRAADRVFYGTSDLQDQMWTLANQIYADGLILYNAGWIDDIGMLRVRQLRDGIRKQVEGFSKEEEGLVSYWTSQVKNAAAVVIGDVLVEASAPIMEEAEVTARQITKETLVEAEERASVQAEKIHERSVVPLIVVGLGITAVLGYFAFK
jgi:hypothetical protein